MYNVPRMCTAVHLTDCSLFRLSVCSLVVFCCFFPLSLLLRSLVCSLARSLSARWPVCMFARSFVHLFPPSSLIYSLVLSFVRLRAHSFVSSFSPSFLTGLFFRSFPPSFLALSLVRSIQFLHARSLIHSFVRSLLPPFLFPSIPFLIRPLLLVSLISTIFCSSIRFLYRSVNVLSLRTLFILKLVLSFLFAFLRGLLFVGSLIRPVCYSFVQSFLVV